MTLPASALPVEAPLAFLGVAHSATGKLWRDRLDARGAARALAIAQRYQLPEMLARVLAGRDVAIDAVEDFLDPTIRKTGDEGNPVVASQPDSAQAKLFKDLAKNVWAKMTEIVPSWNKSACHVFSPKPGVVPVQVRL